MIVYVFLAVTRVAGGWLPVTYPQLFIPFPTKKECVTAAASSTTLLHDPATKIVCVPFKT